LDPDSKKEFFATINTNMPTATLITITHDQNVVDKGLGYNFSKRITFSKGRASLEEIPSQDLSHTACGNKATGIELAPLP